MNHWFQDLPDSVKRALHTFWQAFLAALVVTYAGSNADLSQVVDVASGQRFVFAVGTAVLAALLSALKSTMAVLVAQVQVRRAASRLVDTGVGSLLSLPEAADARPPLVTGSAAPQPTFTTTSAQPGATITVPPPAPLMVSVAAEPVPAAVPAQAAGTAAP